MAGLRQPRGLLLSADCGRQVGTGREANALVCGDGYALPGLSATDRADLPLFDLSGFKCAESGQYNAVASCEGLTYAVEHCVERCVAL